EDNSLLPALVPIIQKYQEEKLVIPKVSDIKKYFDLLLNSPQESYIEKAESHELQKIMVKFLYFFNSFESHNLNLRGGKQSDNPVKENIKLIRELFKGPVLSIAISCMQAGFILSIMSLLTKLQDIYLARKREVGILTYMDVAKLSRTILLKEKDIRQSEKDAFKAIMIDEFQDNNELQKDILFLLAEKPDVLNDNIPAADALCPDKLFFVGDEKQSIYLFRGADVSVFRKLYNELKSENLPLRINYRSTPHLIGVFNTIFGGCVFDSTGESPLSVYPSVFMPMQSLPYEAVYTPLKAFKTNNGKFSIYILNSHNNSKNKNNEETLLSSDENEAFFVAEKIRQLLDEKTEDGKQKYQPHDIAILFRTGTPQFHFEKHLRFLNIPYTCDNINDLFYGGLINDIISVLRLVSYPTDNASYAEMLRSPFAGLSLSGTALCLSLKGQPFDDKPLLLLDKEDSEKYRNGQKVYFIIQAKAETENISSLISELWYNEGYRYETEWNPQTRIYLEIYDYLFHYAAAADSENQTLASFTDSLISARDKSSELPEVDIPLERPGAVKLTSIHKSKGLEFPVVFLCCCGRTSKSNNVEAFYHSDTSGLAFSPPPPAELKDITVKKSNYFWKQASEEAENKRIAELRRLLYVGMTRAENELYITGSLKIKNNDNTNDFSLLLKNHINEQCENKENYIEGDSIINNDTLFGLLLPSITCHIPLDGFKKDTLFFNLDEIPRVSEEDANNTIQKNTGLKNNQKGLNEFFKKTGHIYEKAQVIQTPVLNINHITPASLRSDDSNINKTVLSSYIHTDKNFIINKEYSGEKSDDIFKKVDSMLKRYSGEETETSGKFSSANFGTIAHNCVEALLNKADVHIPANISSLLTPSELSDLLEAGYNLANRFMLSPLGKMANNASIRENEFPFRSIIKNNEENEIFINGIIDLFFEDNNTIHIIDFKTDSIESPNEHLPQMSCYYQAISSLYKKQCRIWLYYLRTGNAVEMTSNS
ncbi:MAG: UvrD-helicase domain-containing protein, partial [Treponema sp.]|nr:UvrD-helicase domain-containing protein [Treponema sp.]